MTYSGPMDNLLAERDKLRAEVERLRAEANARAVEWVIEELEALNGMSELSLRAAIQVRIAELSKPAAKESEPVQDAGTTFQCYGVTFTADPKAPRSAVHQALTCIEHAFTSVTTMIETKPEEPDWTVTLAAQAKVAYARTDDPADEAAIRLLSLIVEGLCELGREVRRGGSK